MSEKEISYLVDSKLIEINHKLSKKKLQFTPLEISDNYFNEVREELIEFNPEIKKKSNSEIISKKIISKIPINIKKVKTNKALSKFIKQDNDNNIVIDNNLSFYGSNSKNTEVISEMKSKDIYNIINENINENNIQFHKRKLTSINDEKLLFDKNSNGNKLYNSKDQIDNNENKDVIIHMKKKFLTNKPKKSFCFSNLKFNQDEVNSLSNIEEITNFYSYTEKCFEMMFYLEKEKIINKCTPLNFPFDKIINEKKKKLVIFDLDETLVHCQVKNIEECQYQIDINLPSKKKAKIGINIRPNLNRALNKIKDKYIIVVFTASHKSYADAVLNFIDPNDLYFKYRLYRNNCTTIKLNGKEIYIKDLSLFKNINLKNIIVVDNSVMSFYFNLNNGIPILPYYNSFKDNELICLSYYLFSIYDYHDLRNANKKNFKLELFKNHVFDKLKLEEDNNESDDSILGLRAENSNYQIENNNDDDINDYNDNDDFDNKNKKILKFNVSENLKESIHNFRKKYFDEKISKGRDMN